MCRKQHSLWVQGDVHRSKQKLVQQRRSRQQQLQQQRQQQLHSSGSVEGGKQEAASCLLSSMDDLSINTTLCKSYSLDEVRSEKSEKLLPITVQTIVCDPSNKRVPVFPPCVQNSCKDSSVTQGDKLRALKGMRPPRSVSSSSRWSMLLWSKRCRWRKDELKHWKWNRSVVSPVQLTFDIKLKIVEAAVTHVYYQLLCS